MVAVFWGESKKRVSELGFTLAAFFLFFCSAKTKSLLGSNPADSFGREGEGGKSLLRTLRSFTL
jgi:hypothetical protein